MGRVKLTDIEIAVLHAAEITSRMGGIGSLYYAEYLRRERLRKLRLLKFYGRRGSTWRRCSYDITPAGRALLASNAGKPPS